MDKNNFIKKMIPTVGFETWVETTQHFVECYKTCPNLTLFHPICRYLRNKRLNTIQFSFNSRFCDNKWTFSSHHYRWMRIDARFRAIKRTVSKRLISHNAFLNLCARMMLLTVRGNMRETYELHTTHNGTTLHNYHNCQKRDKHFFPRLDLKAQFTQKYPVIIYSYS